MKNIPEIKLYGTASCHKTIHYKELLAATEFPYQYLDVNENKTHAEELRKLYQNRKLNFPTITIGTKKLRNPKDEELKKWLQKLLK
ncbi:glutaredoxin family protein [Kordia sp.]|uniref:glutaredoxin family protein n=1 Tax=Kordia sp. TaxID=1965332 RepID=UPI003D2E3540